LALVLVILTLSIPWMTESAQAQSKVDWPKGVTIGAAPLN